MAEPKNPIFEFRFKDFSSANSIAQEMNTAANLAFQSETWLTRQNEILMEALRGNFKRLTHLPFIASTLDIKKIIDFGGGSGWVFATLGDPIKDRIEKYQVIENNEMCKFFATKFSNEKISFSTVDSIKKNHLFDNTDILYLNSVMQYFENQEYFNLVVDSYSPEYILIDDLVVSPAEEFFSLQEYYGNKIPYRFSDINEIRSSLSERRYTELVNIQYGINIDFDFEFKIKGHEEIIIPSSRTLLYKKSQ